MVGSYGVIGCIVAQENVALDACSEGRSFIVELRDLAGVGVNEVVDQVGVVVIADDKLVLVVVAHLHLGVQQDGDQFLLLVAVEHIEGVFVDVLNEVIFDFIVVVADCDVAKGVVVQAEVVFQGPGVLVRNALGAVLQSFKPNLGHRNGALASLAQVLVLLQKLSLMLLDKPSVNVTRLESRVLQHSLEELDVRWKPNNLVIFQLKL